MKKLLLIILLLFGVNATAQIDTASWSITRNKVDGKYSLLTNRVTLGGVTAGNIIIPLQYTLNEIDTSNYSLKRNQTNGKYSLAINKTAIYGIDSGLIQVALIYDLGGVNLGNANTWTGEQTFGNVVIDSATITYLNVTSSDTLYTNVIPTTDSTYDIGSAAAPFRRGYFSSNLYSSYLWASNYVQTTAIYNTAVGSKTSIKFVGTVQDSIQLLTNNIARITIDTTGATNIHGNYFYLVGNASTTGSWRFKATLSGDVVFEYTANGTDWVEKSRITK